MIKFYCVLLLIENYIQWLFSSMFVFEFESEEFSKLPCSFALYLSSFCPSSCDGSNRWDWERLRGRGKTLQTPNSERGSLFHRHAHAPFFIAT